MKLSKNIAIVIVFFCILLHPQEGWSSDIDEPLCQGSLLSLDLGVVKTSSCVDWGASMRAFGLLSTWHCGCACSAATPNGLDTLMRFRRAHACMLGALRGPSVRR